MDVKETVRARDSVREHTWVHALVATGTVIVRVLWPHQTLKKGHHRTRPHNMQQRNDAHPCVDAWSVDSVVTELTSLRARERIRHRSQLGPLHPGAAALSHSVVC